MLPVLSWAEQNRLGFFSALHFQILLWLFLSREAVQRQWAGPNSCLVEVVLPLQLSCTRLCYLGSSVFFSNFHSLLKQHCSGSFPKPVIFTASFSLALTSILKPFLPVQGLVCKWAPQSQAVSQLAQPVLWGMCGATMTEPKLSLTTHVNSRFLVQLMRASVFFLLSLAVPARHQRSQQHSLPQLLTQKDDCISLCLECCSLSPHLAGLSLLSGSHLTFSETFLSLEKIAALLLWLTCVPGSSLGTFRWFKLPEQMRLFVSYGACSLPFCKLSLTLSGWENVQFEFLILIKRFFGSLCVCVCVCCNSEDKPKETGRQTDACAEILC